MPLITYIQLAEQQKPRVDPMYHEKIDHLLDTYARKLAENMNQGFAIDARVPSVMIAGPANFPVGKKEKQNRARDSNMEEGMPLLQGVQRKEKTVPEEVPGADRGAPPFGPSWPEVLNGRPGADP